jgi:hypothetical protein
MGLGDFMTGLGSIINDQFGFGETQPTSLDTTTNGRVTDYGLLGKFANKFDHTAERTYIEDGFVRNVRPRLREVLFQQPDITVLIKKRMFSSLAENYRLDLLEDKEKLFIRASKRLFQNKCKLIAAYERLTKIERISLSTGQFNTYLAPMLFKTIDLLDSLSREHGQQLMSPETRLTFDTLRNALSFSDTSTFTEWTTYPDEVFPGELGEGFGVIELTTVAHVTTKVSNKFKSGSASLTIEDPYKLMVFSTEDIESAINDATNTFKNAGFGRFTEIETSDLVEKQKAELSVMRSNRGAGSISFMANSQVLIGKKLRAINDYQGEEIIFTFNPGLVGLGSSVEVDKAFLYVAGKNPQGLNSNEENLFRKIVSNIYLLMGFEAVTQSNVRQYNQDANYVRNKMREHYAGMPLIQPVDVISVFMTTRTTEDSKLIDGFNHQGLGGYQIGQTFDNLFRNINATLQDLSGDQNSPDDVERVAIAGPKFPPWLWKLFRNDFTRQSAGTCVFYGLVAEATHKYADGKYTLSVSCEDNAGYFDKSQINIKPAIDAWNSTLYDPLTPFDVSFDAATGVPITDINAGNFPPLLPENKRMLEESKLIRFKTGRFTGQIATGLTYTANDGEVAFGTYRKVLSDPDGLVYRWKSGIQSLTKTDRILPASSIIEDRSPLLTRSPLAGQDVMNALSLTITGQPYNYNTFLKAAIDNANSLGGPDGSNSPVATSYIASLVRELSRRNVIWGNFVPFKKLVFNKEADAFIRQGQADFITQNNQLQQLIKERAQLQDQLAFNTFSTSNSPVTYGIDNTHNLQPSPLTTSLEGKQIQAGINDLDTKIALAQQAFENSLSQNNTIRIIADEADIGQSSGNEEQNTFDQLEFRKKLNNLTQRRLWKVKSNTDVNLFIVDDQYDKNFDLMAFERKIQATLHLFESEYSTIDQDIKNLSMLLGLEVFSDSQGNIQARPPQYNRVPSTVFYKMFKNSDDNGIKVFPDFLESLYTNQIQGLISQLEIIEDQIRLRVVALGVVPNNPINKDAEIQTFLNSKNLSNGKFVFISSPDTGKIGSNDLQSLFFQAKPDLVEALTTKPLAQKMFGNLETTINDALSSTRLFDTVNRYKAYQTLPDLRNITKQSTTVADRIYEISKRLSINKGVIAPTLKELYTNQRVNSLGKKSQLDIVNIISQIAEYVSERQRMLVSLSNCMSNLKEGIDINTSNKSANAALTPFLRKNTAIPPILAHMIEDETQDDLGPNSGKRFILKDSQIVSLEIIEKAPDHTLIQVNGLFGEGFVDPAASLGIGGQNGNAQTSAFAVDYDMWRRYGFRAPNSINMPMFSDPDTQCAPYCVFLMNLARKNILRGNVSVQGYNEFYQPGDVVYIEDRDLLFYVDDVSHSFSYDGSLSTSLSLSYGHAPGIYIPTSLDIVGKLLYNARGFTGQFRNSRYTADDGDQSIGAIIVETQGTSDLIEAITSGPRGQLNKSILSNTILAASGLLNPVGTRQQQFSIELRYYGNSAYTSQLEQAADAINNWLNNPEHNSNLNGKILSIEVPKTGTIPAIKINKAHVLIDDGTTRTPSSAAWSAARLVEGEYSAQEMQTNLDDIISNTIIDIWLVIEDLPETTSSTSENSQGGNNQNSFVTATNNSVNQDYGMQQLNAAGFIPPEDQKTVLQKTDQETIK